MSWGRSQIDNTVMAIPRTLTRWAGGFVKMLVMQLLDRRHWDGHCCLSMWLDTVL